MEREKHRKVCMNISAYAHLPALLFSAAHLCKDDDAAVSSTRPSRPLLLTLCEEVVTASDLMMGCLGMTFRRSAGVSYIYGGKEANVISVKNDALYCVVPKGA